MPEVGLPDRGFGGDRPVDEAETALSEGASFAHYSEERARIRLRHDTRLGRTV